MEALALLKKDHAALERLFRSFEATAADHERRGEIGGEIIRQLSQHTAIEEQLFYPTIRTKSRELELFVFDALGDHRIVKQTLLELENVPAESLWFSAKMEVLIASVRNHVLEEEGPMFDKVREQLKASELGALGRALAEAKKQAPDHPSLADVAAMPFEVAAEAVHAATAVGTAMVRRAPRPVAAKQARAGGGARKGSSRSSQRAKKGARSTAGGKRKSR